MDFEEEIRNVDVKIKIQFVPKWAADSGYIQ